MKKWVWGALVLVYTLGLISQWAVMQFAVQSDLGMYLIGESRLGQDVTGVAKFSIDGEKFIRAYGIFEHANILAGVLVIGILAYGLVGEKIRSKALIYPLFFIALALLLSGSRTGWASGLMGVMLTWKVWCRDWLIWLLLLLFLSPVLWFRSSDSSDVSVSERRFGVEQSIGIIKMNNIWSGSGWGNYETVLRETLESDNVSYYEWQIEPVHNAWLLVAAEFGWGWMLVAWVGLCIGLALILGNKIVWLTPALILLVNDHYLITSVGAIAWWGAWSWVLLWYD